MRNLVLTLLVAPIFCFLQLNADLQLIEVDPARIIVDNGLYIKDEGAVIAVQNFIVRQSHVFAVLADEDESIRTQGWIFMYPPDAIKQFGNRPMGNIALDVVEESDEATEECKCGCHETNARTFIKARGQLNSWLQNILQRSGDRRLPFETRNGCGCRPRKSGNSYIHPATGDVIISINIEEEESNSENPAVKIYMKDREVVEIILQNSYEEELEDQILQDEQYEEALEEVIAALEDELDAAYEQLDELSEISDQMDLIFGYDRHGAFYYNPNSFFQLQNQNLSKSNR